MPEPLRIYYVANARMPSEKAHGIQIALMCDALIAQGAELELIVPDRGVRTQSVQEFYGLAHEVPTKQMPILDLYFLERIGFFLTSCIFMLKCVAYLRTKARRGEEFIIYTVDIDSFSSVFLRLVGRPYFSELHGGKPRTLRNRYLFKKMAGAIAINSRIKSQMVECFDWSGSRVIVEPNGVDIEAFSAAPGKAAARAALKLPEHEHIALYTGRFFAWKGLEILPEAMRHVAKGTQLYIVGGSPEEFKRISGVADIPPNVHIVGGRPYQEMPLWQAAADALVVLGTKANDYSYLYTAPMKVYEYAASRRLLIAADTPALREHLSDADALFYQPDDALSLAHCIEESRAGAFADRIESAYHKAKEHSWSARAARTLALIRRCLS
jgi:glycosyltransferase involved in cell wall biosynthesis